MFGAPLAFLVSLADVVFSTKKGWAIAGVVLSGLPTLYIAFCLTCAMLYAR